MLVRLKNKTGTFLSVPLRQGTIELKSAQISAVFNDRELTSAAKQLIQKGLLVCFLEPSKAMKRDKSERNKK